MDPASAQEPANVPSLTEKETTKETKTEKEIINETEKETIKDAEKETINEAEKETIEETEKEIMEETEKEIISKTEKETIKEAEKQTINATEKETIQETEKEKATKETTEEAAKETIEETEKGTIQETGKETIEETEKEIIQETAKETPKVAPKRKSDFGLPLPSSSDILHKRAASIFPSIADAICRGDKQNAMKILEESSMEAYYTAATPKPKEASGLNSKMLDQISEGLTEMLMGLIAGDISVPAGPDKTKVIEKIRSSIIWGDIGQATILLNEHYYKLLHDPIQLPNLRYFLEYQNVIELVRQRQVEPARQIAETSIKNIADSHPWLREEVECVLSLLNCEDPWQSPHKELLDISRRHQTANLVLGLIAIMDNDDDKKDTLLSSSLLK